MVLEQLAFYMLEEGKERRRGGRKGKEEEEREKIGEGKRKTT